MKKYTYLIIGGGIAAASAVNGIREKDKEGSIGILTSEAYKPYSRPPLSKDLWKEMPVDKIWLQIEDEKTDIQTNNLVVELNLKNKYVSTQSGEEFGYQTLLIATGAEPKRLPFTDEDIIYFRKYSDYLRVRDLAEKQDYFAVIGAGFIGSEIAAALALKGKKVFLIETGAGIGWRVFPQEIVEYLNELYVSKGVQILANTVVKNIVNQGNCHRIILNNGQTIQVDGVIAGVGVKASSQIAEKAGIFVEDGIRVNSYLETSAPDVFAAGDVAAFHSPALDKTLRVEHNDNAKKMGQIAGINMASGNLEYDYLPMFYSDLFEIGYEAVGLIDTRLDPKVIWKEEFKSGVIYYRKENIIKGILLWNEWGKVDIARAIIREQKWIEEKNLQKLI
ncbi:MAG: NAD(P)/FAD-dependent oxidoreductase [Anaerolineaceae bacterium]|jgi:NADPH-dependent 2,4-dienoyl-CoA reductase/sulfur reductase-like enzyme|nr:MAG: NAD(P)/FAD-dependent oxidoreductase [Anaerolineaceae bacterium]